MESFGGRFSNGPVWVEYVAGNLSVPLVDYAVGGGAFSSFSSFSSKANIPTTFIGAATTSNTLVQGFTGPASTIPVPSVADQVASFLALPPSALLTNPLFIFLAGANDPLFNPNITAAQSFRALADARAQLAAAHPRAHVLALGYPDLSRLPADFYMDPAGQRVLRVFTKELDALWRSEVRAVSGSHLADVQAADGARLMYVDARPLFALFEYYGTPATYGFAPLGAYGSCLTGAYGETAEVTLCADAEEHVWWDEYQ